MQKYLLILALMVSGCGGVQRVAECTAESVSPLLEPLGNLVWDDVRGKRAEPSKFVSDTVAAIAVESGVAVVRCALKELIGRWSTGRSVAHGWPAERSVETEIAIKIAQDLHDEL